jgi:hypothetical protein
MRALPRFLRGSPAASLLGLFLIVSGFSIVQSLVSFGAPTCGSKTELFTSFPVALDDIIDLAPLGQLTPPGHVLPAPHNYIYVIDYQNPTDKEALVYAPGDMTLKHIGLRHYNTIGQYTDYTDYTLLFTVCSEFDLYFHHVRSLSPPSFTNAAAQITATCNFSTTRNEDYCSGNVNIRIRAGDIIGTTGDLKGGVYGLDIGARDYRLSEGRTRFANPDRYCSPLERNAFSRCYTVCPFDYYPTEIRQQLQFTGKSGQIVRTEPPVCGGVHYDGANTARGNWFLIGVQESIYSPEASFLFVGPDNVRPSISVFSVGTAVPSLPPGAYEFQPATSGPANLDFGSVTADGQIHCYEAGSQMFGNTKVIVLQLLDSTTLRIEGSQAASCGSGPWAFTQNFTDFER